jgi:hypothetical protein
MNRTAQIKDIIARIAPDASVYSIHTSGPYSCYGKRGEVSMTVYSNLWDVQMNHIADLIELLMPGCVRAYITRKANRRVRTGGNLKVVFNTRANGEPA